MGTGVVVPTREQMLAIWWVVVSERHRRGMWAWWMAVEQDAAG